MSTEKIIDITEHEEVIYDTYKDKYEEDHLLEHVIAAGIIDKDVILMILKRQLEFVEKYAKYNKWCSVENLLNVRRLNTAIKYLEQYEWENE